MFYYYFRNRGYGQYADAFNGVHDKKNYFSNNIIVQTINIQVISVYESIFCA